MSLISFEKMSPFLKFDCITKKPGKPEAIQIGPDYVKSVHYNIFIFCEARKNDSNSQ